MINQVISGGFRSVFHRLFQADLKIGRLDAAPLEPLQVDGLYAACHKSWPPAEGFVPAWSRLLAENPRWNSFQSPAWQRVVIQKSVPAGRLRLLTVNQDKDLLAVLPLQLTDAGVLESVGAATCDYLDPLLSPGYEPACWHAILSLLRKLWDWRVRALVLHNIPGDSPCRQQLASIASQHGLRLEETAVDPVLQVPLPRTGEEYWASLERSHRREFRRKMNKFEGEPSARFAVYENEEEIREHLPAVLTMMEAAHPEKAEVARQLLRPLLTEAVPALAARGEVKILALWIRGQLAAGDIVLRSHQGLMGYNGGFDQSLREWGPGSIIRLMAIQLAIQQGDQVLDMLRGSEPYKYRFGAAERPLYRLRLRPCGASDIAT